MQELKVSELIPHPQNGFYFDDMDGQKWQEFLESVRTSGVIEPPVVTDRCVIVSGHQRIRACKELGIETLNCEVRNYDSEDLVLKDLIETNIRQRGTIGGSDQKMRRIILEMERIYGISRGGDRKSKVDNPPLKTQVEIANELSLTRDEYKMHKKISQMSPEIRELVDNGVVSGTTAYKLLSKLSEEEQLTLLSQLPATQKYTQAQVQAEVDKIRQQSDNVVTALKRSITSKEQIIAEKEKTIEALENTPVSNEPEDAYYLEMKQKMDDAQAKERKASVVNSQLEARLATLEKQARAQTEAHRKEMAEMERRLDNVVEAEPEVDELPEYIAMKKELEGLRAELEQARMAKNTKVKDDRIVRVMGYKTDDEVEITELEVALNGLFSSIKGNLCGYVREKDSLRALAADTRERLIEQGEAALFTLQTVLQIMGWEESLCKQAS